MIRNMFVLKKVAQQHKSILLTRNFAYDFSKIIYTETDEAPMLATYSLLPVI